MAETKTKAKKSQSGKHGKNVIRRQKSSDGIVPHDEHAPEEQKKLIAKGKSWIQQMGYPTYEELMETTVGGRPKFFESSAVMYERACAYFQWNKENPWVRYEYKDKKMRAIKIGRPFTMEGLCIYLRCSPDYFHTFESQLKKDDPDYLGFMRVIKFIRFTIRNQKFEGAAVGAFNANLISYDLGMRKDVGISGGSGQGLNIIIENPDYESLLEETKAALMALDDDGDASKIVVGM